MNKQDTIAMFDAICRTGIDNSEWGVCEDVNTRDFFGATESTELKGAWLYVFLNRDGENPLDWYHAFRTGRTLPCPDYSIRIVDEDCPNDFVQDVIMYQL